jgi:hypothetical protein
LVSLVGHLHIERIGRLDCVSADSASDNSAASPSTLSDGESEPSRAKTENLIDFDFDPRFKRSPEVKYFFLFGGEIIYLFRQLDPL